MIDPVHLWARGDMMVTSMEQKLQARGIDLSRVTAELPSEPRIALVRALTLDYLDGGKDTRDLLAIHKMLAPFGLFREWCRATEVNYLGSIAIINRQKRQEKQRAQSQSYAQSPKTTQQIDSRSTRHDV